MGVMDDRRRILMAQDGFVPPEYQKYDYLQCTGQSSRIDTGIAGNDNSLEFDFIYMPMEKKDYSGHFGNATAGGYNPGYKLWRVVQGSTTYSTNMVFSVNSSASLKWIAVTTTNFINQKIHLTLSYEHIKSVNINSGYTRNETQSDDGSTSISTQNICIGSIGVNVTSYATTNARFYGDFKIKKNGVLVRNYIPVVRKSDNKAGFYDTVNHTFNPSIGSAEFIAGND